MKALLLMLLIAAFTMSSCRGVKVYMTKDGQKITKEAVTGYTSIQEAVWTDDVQIELDKKRAHASAVINTYNKYNQVLDTTKFERPEEVLDLSDRLIDLGGAQTETNTIGKRVSVNFENRTKYDVYIQSLSGVKNFRGLGLTPGELSKSYSVPIGKLIVTYHMGNGPNVMTERYEYTIVKGRQGPIYFQPRR